MSTDAAAFDATDPFGFRVLNITELKAELNGRGIQFPSSLRKGELVLLLTDAVQTEIDRDDEMTLNEEYI